MAENRNTDYLPRNAIERFIENGLNNPDRDKAFGHDAIEILAEVHYMPAADVTEVVRCKDCKYFLPPIKSVFTACSYMKGGGMLAPNLNDYCSRGERRNE